MPTLFLPGTGSIRGPLGDRRVMFPSKRLSTRVFRKRAVLNDVPLSPEFWNQVRRLTSVTSVLSVATKRKHNT